MSVHTCANRELTVSVDGPDGLREYRPDQRVAMATVLSNRDARQTDTGLGCADTHGVLKHMRSHVWRSVFTAGRLEKGGELSCPVVHEVVQWDVSDRALLMDNAAPLLRVPKVCRPLVVFSSIASIPACRLKVLTRCGT